MYVLHPHAQQAALPSHLVHRQCHAHVQSWGLPLPNAAQHFFFYHPGRQRVVSSHCLLFSDRLPPAPQLSQKLAFQLSLPLLEERRRANTACSLIFVCLSVRASVCARHMEVNTSNLALKECSVFRSRPSLFRRPTTTDVHLGNSAAEVQGGWRHGVLRRPEVTLEEKSITAQDVLETLVSQWVCSMDMVCVVCL